MTYRSTGVGVFLAALALVMAVVGSGNAGNRNIIPPLDPPIPGTAAEPVTRGESVLFETRFPNATKANFVDVVVRVPLSSAAGTFIDGSCPGTEPTAPENTYWFCNVGTVRSGETSDDVQFVIDTPDTGTASTLTMSVDWSAKEGFNDSAGASGLDFWTTSQTIVIFGSAPDQSKAAGYQVSNVDATSCEGGTLKTGGTLGAGNAISTEVCLPDFDLDAALGLQSRIAEGGTLTGSVTEISDVCVAAEGDTCAADNAFDFGSALVKHTFRVPDAALAKGVKITRWFHRPDGESGPLSSFLLPACTDPRTEECATITYSAKDKLWTIVAYTRKNGIFGGF